MTSKIFYPLLLTIFIACSQSTRTNDIHIVPKPYNPDTDKKTNEPPPPIPTYYLPFNFIIDTAEQVYFYQQQQFGWSCETDIDYNTPPEFIDLKPKDLVRVPINGLADFVKLNLLNTDDKDKRVAVASMQDTISSKALSTIFKIFSNRSNRIKWLFRKATQEESIVLKHKELNWKYFAYDIEWDSTKIRFRLPPKITEE